MMEEKINFMSKGLSLEGLISKGSKDKAVVVTHPHPLYGGDMYNPVVETICLAYGKKGYTTLRFNFRGAGNSQGAHDEGKGEQTDVNSALDYLSGLGAKNISLAGYSFGSWINALAACRLGLNHPMVMVSPPVAFIDFKNVGALPGLRYIVTGAEDEIAPTAHIRQMAPLWNTNAKFEVIEGADHFYFGFLNTLEGMLSKHIGLSANAV